eukprot:1656868-Pyramimonas_sp.AAC.1
MCIRDSRSTAASAQSRTRSPTGTPAISPTGRVNSPPRSEKLSFLRFTGCPGANIHGEGAHNTLGDSCRKHKQDGLIRRVLRHILSPLPRLVPATRTFSLPFRDWCPLRVRSPSPSAIGITSSFKAAFREWPRSRYSGCCRRRTARSRSCTAARGTPPGTPKPRQLSARVRCYGTGGAQTSKPAGVTGGCYRRVLPAGVTGRCYRRVLPPGVTNGCYQRVLPVGVTSVANAQSSKEGV